MTDVFVLLRAAVLMLAVPAAAACGEGRTDARVRAESAAQPLAQDTAPAALHRRLFEQGATWDEFLAGVERRVELWRELAAAGALPADLVSRARAAAERHDWRLLIVAEDGCSDSASTVPYIARLAQQTGALDVRIVDAAAGRPVMEGHRTPDGRAATPTVLLLDASYEELGCWVERPAALQSWYIANQSTLRSGELADQKAGWYRGDRGRDTLAEIVAVLESADAGQPRC